MRILFLVVLAAGLAGCILDLEGLTGGCRDCEVHDGGEELDAGCPGNGGPSAVRVVTDGGSFCIDSTEVTNAQYQPFLAARGSDTSGQRAVCAWNSSFEPSVWPVANAKLNVPVLGVDFCDAAAFCEWAGKRLCGQIGGGTLATTSANDPSISAWFAACSQGGERTYPYGSSFDNAKCIDAQVGPAEVRSAGACVSGYGGIFDLSGNAEEWIDACDGQTAGAAGATESCLAVGGSHNDFTAGMLDCSAQPSQLKWRSVRDSWRGFRCCSN